MWSCSNVAWAPCDVTCGAPVATADQATTASSRPSACRAWPKMRVFMAMLSVNHGVLSKNHGFNATPVYIAIYIYIYYIHIYIHIYMCVYVWSLVSCSRPPHMAGYSPTPHPPPPPPHTHTYTQCIHLHIHIWPIWPFKWENLIFVYLKTVL